TTYVLWSYRFIRPLLFSGCFARLELLVHVHFGQWIDEIGPSVVEAMAFVALAQLRSFHEDALVEAEHRSLGKFLEQRARIAIVFAQHAHEAVIGAAARRCIEEMMFHGTEHI